jgi:hypothetical protein
MVATLPPVLKRHSSDDPATYADREEIWTEMPIHPGEKLCDLPEYLALTREGWQLSSAYIGSTQFNHRYVRLYLTRSRVR